VLSLGVLLEGMVDGDMDGLAAPFEFLAAAAGAGSIGIDRHAMFFLAEIGWLDGTHAQDSKTPGRRERRAGEFLPALNSGPPI
jgi:hypothetical protein